MGTIRSTESNVDVEPPAREALLDLAFSGELVFWRGPSPWYFVQVPDDASAAVRAVAAVASYGWGCIPVRARIEDRAFVTSLFPKDGRYLLPLKAAVRTSLGIVEGDIVPVQMVVGT